MRHFLWAFALAALACGGKARTEASSESGGAGQSGGSAGGALATCPNSEPGEGHACPVSGATCPGFGSFSCPHTAICVNGAWQINCPAVMLGGGACGCAHHGFGRVPEAHRSAAVACSSRRAASITTPDGGCVPFDAGPACPPSECSQDSQCTAGKNGRCVQSGPLPGFSCSYDECETDSDCGKGSVCQCRDPLEGVGANYCTKPSTCTTDADCGEGGYCSPSQGQEWCAAIYVCHAASDTCLNDSDCPESVHCDFDSTVQHWACGNGCGPIPP